MSFNIGFTFYYWPHYAKLAVFDQNTEINTNDHAAYSIRELYTSCKHSSSKEELSNYPDLDMALYEKVILPKINEYSASKKVTQTTASLDPLMSGANSA